MDQGSDLPVDLVRLAAWMETQGLGRGHIERSEPIPGGTQNILLRLTFTGREYVLRRPPLHKRANSDETMRREARVLEALAGTKIPIPALVASCPDVDVLGAAFYLMEPVEGFGVRTEVPEPHRSNPEWQRRMGLDIAHAGAELGEVDPAQLGLADLGRPEGWLERQVARWRSQLDGYAEIPGYPGQSLPGLEAVARWLSTQLPATWRPGLIHGDFGIGNMLFSRREPRVAAVVDWELTTIGDPLLDLAHLLALWPPPDAPRSTLAEPLPGLPYPDGLIEAYADRSTRSLEHFLWYRVLACYRLGIILEGTYARACAGQAPTDVGDRLHARADNLFRQAIELISGN